MTRQAWHNRGSWRWVHLRILRLAGIALATSQIQATCVYSPPPIPSHGQSAEPLGPNSVAVGTELGWGARASWWDSKHATDVDVKTGWVGVARFRYGLSEDVDIGVVGGVGPQSTYIVGPETKWRFSHLAPGDAADAPGFHASLISGLGVGTSEIREDESSMPRHMYLAPYTGVLASGGIRVVQMFVGLRMGASETLGNEVSDLTLYPLLAFGVQVRPTNAVALYAEGDVGGGITTEDIGNSALIGYPSIGIALILDEL